MADAPIGSEDGLTPAVIVDATTPTNVTKVLATGAMSTDTTSWLGSTAPTVGAKTSANSVPVVLASDQAGFNTFLDKSGSGTIGAVNGTVAVATNGCSSVVFNVLGTWVATLQLEATVDGTNWFISMLYTTPGQGVPDYAVVTANGTLIVPCGGFSQVRLRATIYTSGTVSVTYDAGLGMNVYPVTNYNPVALNATVTQGPAASLANAWSAKITDGTDLAQVSAAGALLVDGSAVTQPVSGTVNPSDSTLSVTATGLTGAAVTATLAAVAGQFHRISSLEIMAYTTLARVGVAAPVLVTSTNLPGSNAWTFATAAVIGSTDTKYFTFSNPYKSTVVNTATTIVCPATLSIIWRVNVVYYSAA